MGLTSIMEPCSRSISTWKGDGFHDGGLHIFGPGAITTALGEQATLLPRRRRGSSPAPALTMVPDPSSPGVKGHDFTM